MILEKTIRELYSIYCSENQDSIVSLGTFIKMKPFYVRPETQKDLEMCCC